MGSVYQYGGIVIWKMTVEMDLMNRRACVGKLPAQMVGEGKITLNINVQLRYAVKSNLSMQKYI